MKYVYVVCFITFCGTIYLHSQLLLAWKIPMQDDNGLIKEWLK